MDKRERILELVKDGVLSVEEGLDLLENLSEEENRAFSQKDFSDADEAETEKQEEASEERKEEKKETKSEDRSEEGKMRADAIEELANRINHYSVAVDRLNEKITLTNHELSFLKGKLAKIEGNKEKEFSDRKNELEKEIISLNKEINSLSSKGESNDQEELNLLKEELNDVLEELYLLENRKDANEEAEELKEEIEALEEKSAQLSEEKNEKMKEMHSLKMQRWTEKAKQLSTTIDLPEDWQEGASKTIDKAGKMIDEGTQNLGGFLRETMKKTKESLRNVDWDEVKSDLSMKEKASFSHEWLYEETTASILDFKNANGKIDFKTSDNDTIKVEAEIKLYEKADALTPLEAFEEKSFIKIDEENFSFQIPSKKIKADLVIYLPERNYDYLRINAMKGDVSFDAFHGNDLYIKNASGDLSFNELDASMLEVNLTKGDLFLKEAKLKDLLVNTTHGDLRVIGDVQSSDLTTVSGDILLTLEAEELLQLSARSVKGDVKVSFPEAMSFEIEASTTLGRVKSRLNVEEKSSEEGKNKTYRFFRLNEGELGQIHLQTNKGNILLKDQDKTEGEDDRDEKTNEI